jgi:hypothetical protein
MCGNSFSCPQGDANEGCLTAEGWVGRKLIVAQAQKAAGCPEGFCISSSEVRLLSSHSFLDNLPRFQG